MKRLLLIFGVMLIGCQSTPAPLPGTATLRVAVIAEPKAGVITANTHVLAYDSPADAPPSGQFERVDYDNLPNVVIYAEPTLGRESTGDLPGCDVKISTPVPADTITAVASVGQKLQFHNDTAAAMNLYSVSDGNGFDLGTIPPGGAAVYTVKSAGVIDVLTDNRQAPMATIDAVPSRWVKLSHSGETVTFTDLPPGACRVVSWHPRLPGQTVTLSLPADRITSTSVKVGVNLLPRIDQP